MAFWTVNLPSLTVSSSSSQAIPCEDTYAISISSPATLTASQATVQVELTSSGTNFQTLLSAGSPVVIPAASVIVISPGPFKQLQLISTTNEAATRTFTVAKGMIT